MYILYSLTIVKVCCYNTIILTLILALPNYEASMVKIFCYGSFLLEIQPLKVKYIMVAEILPVTLYYSNNFTTEGRHACHCMF